MDITLAAGSRVQWWSPYCVFLIQGRATFTVDHDPKVPFQVVARWNAEQVDIDDRGTTFTVDLTEPSSWEPKGAYATLLLTVQEGAVTANGVRVEKGHGVTFEAGHKPTGPVWPLDARPTLTLEKDGAPSKAGEPVSLRLVLSNATDGWVAIPAPDPIRGPVFVEVTDPAGSVTPVRITPEMLTGEGRLAGGIPPRGKLALGVRFEKTFALRGTYRLRAVYQPLGAVERPVSPDLLIEIH